MSTLTILLIIAGLAALAAGLVVLRLRANKKKISGKGSSDDIYPMW